MFRKYLRNSFLSTIGRLKGVSEGIHILNGHYISRSKPLEETFLQLLKKINNHSDLVNFEDAIEAIENKDFVGNKLVAFSFDDGFKECYTMIAPSLQKFNVNAAFFINPGFVNGNLSYIENFCKNIVHVKKEPMSWLQIKELYNNGYVIGNHTYDHLRLSEVPSNLHYKQIVDSKLVIEQNIGGKCDYFAWPYGKESDINTEALDLAMANHKYLFAAQGAEEYNFLGMKNVLNRRHIEGDWPISHVRYFLSRRKS